jgi:uncharacterized membrane protein YgdD (TMEM256/DUF423 family)
MNGTRWTGVVGAIAFAAYLLLHPARDAASVRGAPYATIHALGAAAMALMVVGMLSLAEPTRSSATRLGRAAYLTAFTGSVLWVGLLFFDAFVNPILATYRPELVHSDAGMKRQIELFGGALVLVASGLVLFIVGYVVLAISAARQGLMTTPAALLLSAGAVVFGGGPVVPLPVEQVGGVLFCAGFILVMCDRASGSSVAPHAPRSVTGRPTGSGSPAA